MWGTQLLAVTTGAENAPAAPRNPGLAALSRFRGNAVAIKVNNRNHDLDIHSGTLPPLWRGEKMDHSLAVLGLVSRE